MRKLIPLTLLFVLSSSCAIASREVHLIPAGYVGTVYILHNIPNGTPLKHEGLSRLYEIPSDGILQSQSSLNDGWQLESGWQYYYVAADGRRQQLKRWVRPSDSDAPDNEVGVYLPRNGSAGANPNCMVEFDEYYVGTKASLKSYAERDVVPYIEEHHLCK